MRLVFVMLILILVLFAGRGIVPMNSGFKSARKAAAKLTAAAGRDTTKRSGRELYYSTCNICHKDSVSSMAPAYSVLTSMTPRAILVALDKGKMRPIAAGLSEEERQSVAEWITQTPLKTTPLPGEAYASFPISAEGSSGIYDQSGWGCEKTGSGFRTRAQAGISAANVGSLTLKWAFAFPDGTIVRSKPAVLGEWLIVGGQYGDVWAIHRHSGKLGWHFEAAAAIRGAIAITKKGNAITAYFADFSSNVYALNARTGKLLWTKRAGFDQQSSTTGSVAVYGGRVFVPITSAEVGAAARGDYRCCFSSGGVVALDALTGTLLWKYRILPKAGPSGKGKRGQSFYGPSGAPVWCSPTVDTKRGLLYIGTGENYSDPPTSTSDAVEAIDLVTGRLVWNFQATPGDTYNVACPMFNNCPPKPGPDLDFGMAPILVHGKDGRDLLLAGQKSGVVYALSPDGGKVIWHTRIGKGGALGGIHWGMATDGKTVYAANADNVIAIDGRDSFIKRSPGIYALDVLTGRVIWGSPTPVCQGNFCVTGNSAAPAMAPGVIFAGALDGHIRAYAAGDGAILWDYNTVREFETVDSVKGSGGSIDGPAPVLAGGMLFVNSGYGMFGQKPGNVLLAFGVKASATPAPALAGH